MRARQPPPEPKELHPSEEQGGLLMSDMEERFGAVDWSNDRHAICVVDVDGTRVEEWDVADTGDGLRDMCRRLKRTKVHRVAIERPDGPVVDALIESGLEVVVVASRSVKASASATGRRGTSPTGPTPTCWLTVSAPMAIAGPPCSQTRLPPSPSDPTLGRART